MARRRFDFEETVGEDYLYFYAARLDDEQNDRDTDAVVRFLDLRRGDAVLDARCAHGRISNRLAERGMHVVGGRRPGLFLAVIRLRTRPSTTASATCAIYR